MTKIARNTSLSNTTPPAVDVSMAEADRLYDDIVELQFTSLPQEKQDAMWPFKTAMTLLKHSPEAETEAARSRALAKYAPARAAFDALMPAATVEVLAAAEPPLEPTPAVGTIGTADVDRGSDERHCDDAVPEGGRATNAVPGPSIDDARGLLKTINGAGRFLKSEERAPMVPFVDAMATYAAAGKDGNTSPVLEAYPPALEALVALGIDPEGTAEKPVEPTPAVGITGTADVDRQNDGPYRQDAVPEGGGTMSAVLAPAVTIEKANRLRKAIRDQWFHFSKLEQAPMLPFMQAMGDFNYGSKRGRDVERALAEYEQAHATFVALAPVERVEALAAAERPLEPLGTEGDASPVLEAYPHCTALGIVPERAPEKPAEPPAASVPAAQPGDVDPASLLPHPFNIVLFGDVPIEAPKQEAFEKDIAEHGVTKPIIVTGAGCRSQPNTILAGHRRAVTAAKVGRRVMVVVRNGLTELEEISLLVRDNLADEHVRKLTVEQKWAMEEKLRELHGKKPGRRTDLEMPNGHLAEISARSRAVHRNEIIGKVVEESPSAVADRAKVYGSPLSTPDVKKAVSDGLIGPSTAARMLRAGEKKLGPGIDEPTVREAAQAEIDAQVQAAVVKKKGPRKKGAGKGAPKELVPSTNTSEVRDAAPAEPWEDSEHSEWATAADREKLLEICKGFSDNMGRALECLRDTVCVAQALWEILGQLPTTVLEDLVEQKRDEGDNNQAAGALDLRQKVLADLLARVAGAAAAAGLRGTPPAYEDVMAPMQTVETAAARAP